MIALELTIGETRQRVEAPVEADIPAQIRALAEDLIEFRESRVHAETIRKAVELR